MGLALLVGWLPLFADGDYVGSASCRSCHPKQYATQTTTNHAKALRPILRTPLPSLLSGAPIQERSGIAFDYSSTSEGLHVTVTRGNDRLSAILGWAFGSGVQAFTPVGLRNGVYFEHRVSYYTAAGRPGRTMGHSGQPSLSLESALGIPQKSETITRCFDCHATGVQSGPDLSRMVVGIQCERCHGPALAHVNAATKGQPHSAIVESIRTFSRMNAADSIASCAECHRMPATNSSHPELDDPESIRFQPIGLMASRCFIESKSLSCVTCHSPHQDSERNVDFYVLKCLQCHQPKNTAVSCKLAKRQNCLPCHMEKQSSAEFLKFTDHRIRIYSSK